jgi:gliding motility-associated-like protein
MVLGPDADTLVYATYMGGSVSAEHVDGGTSRFSPEGIVYHAVCAGCGGNQDFPLNNPFAAYPSNLSNNCNALVFKLDLELVRPRAILRIIPGDTNVCVGSPILFENRGTAGSSQWWQIAQTGQAPIHTAQSSTTTYTFALPGVYTVRLIVEGCQLYDTAYRTVVVSNPPVIQKFAPPPACPGDTVWLRIDSVDVNGNFLTVNWISNPALLPPGLSPYRRQALISGSGWFYFDVFSSSGCVLRDSIQTLTVPAKPVFVQDTLRWCWGSPVSLSALSGYSSYRWSSDIEIANINQANQIFNLLLPRWVTCRIYDDTCFHVDSVYLLPEITLTVSLGPDIYFCGQVSRTFVPVGGTFYQWSDGSTGPSFSLNALGDGLVWVIASDANGCRSLPDTLRYFDDPVSATINLQPSDTAYAPQAVFFASTLTANVDSVYWYFGDGGFGLGPTTVHIYAETGAFDGYMVAVSRRSGCRDSIPFRLVVDTVILDFPNAFIPGSGGVNAVFRSFYRNLEEVRFTVFDRWGQVIFETLDPEVSWDGTSKGQDVMSGTYVYMAKGRGKNGAEYLRKGLLHLVR